jgi:hypothetical protein
VFDDEGSYILNKHTGVKTTIEQRNGTYAFDIWVQVPIKKDMMDVDAVGDEGESDGGGETAGAGFLRHL